MITATRRKGFSLAAHANGVLAKFGAWRIGRSDGRRALIRVYGRPRQIVLWPRPKVSS